MEKTAGLKVHHTAWARGCVAHGRDRRIEACGEKAGNAMKCKVGDTVRIQSKEWMDAQEKDGLGAIRGPEIINGVITEGMRAYAGRPGKIVKVYNSAYALDIDNKFYLWQDWMLVK